MRLFKCQHCGQVLNFENVRCERCAHRLGYLPLENVLSALEPDGAAWRPLAAPERSHRFCANAAYDACNWLVPSDQPDEYCMACRHNRTVPNLATPANLPPWRSIERAKHRLLYTLLRLRLPLHNRIDDPAHGLAFDFLADAPAGSGHSVMTGHENGVITLALAEADDAERERRRVQLGEPYRTLLGHLRHEVGHYFWDRLVRDRGMLDACRSVFGDDRRDYAEALRQHYARGAPLHWQDRFVSGYASAHPWEDFAETWSHYLQIVDTLEMARAFGLSVNPRVDATNALTSEVNFDPHRVDSIARLIDAWLPLTFAMNNISRCMGTPDLYPFILSTEVVGKLGFIHEIVRTQGASGASASA